MYSATPALESRDSGLGVLHILSRAAEFLLDFSGLVNGPGEALVDKVLAVLKFGVLGKPMRKGLVIALDAVARLVDIRDGRHLPCGRILLAEDGVRASACVRNESLEHEDSDFPACLCRMCDEGLQVT